MKDVLAYLAILAFATIMQAQGLPKNQPFELTAMRLSTDLTP